MEGQTGITRTSREIVEQSKRVAIEFLMAELAVALTFLDVAETTARGETRTRNEQNARTAYFTVLHHLPRVEPADRELPTVHAKLAELKGRLQLLGHQLDPEPEPPSGR